MIKDPETFKNKNVVISGGGDSALDWTIELEKLINYQPKTKLEDGIKKFINWYKKYYGKY